MNNIHSVVANPDYDPLINYHNIQLTANQTARLPFYGVKWPFSRGRGP